MEIFGARFARMHTANRLVALSMSLSGGSSEEDSSSLLLFRFGQFAVVVIEGKVQLLRLGRHSARTSEASSKSSSVAAQLPTKTNARRV